MKNALDYETVQIYKLVVRATIPSVPPRFVEKTFDVNVVDVNDHSPVFAVDNPDEEMKLFIDQYSPKGTIVGKVWVIKGFIFTVYFIYIFIYLHNA